MHRVLDIGIERFSSPFFLRPKYSAYISSTILPGENEAKEEPGMFGDQYLEENIGT